jgi:hypothetical protein
VRPVTFRRASHRPLLTRVVSSPQARRRPLELFVTLADGPTFPLRRGGGGGAAARGAAPLFPGFAVISMPRHYADVALPWHDHLQAERGAPSSDDG